MGSGTIVFDIEEVSGGQVATTTTFVDVPVATSTIVTMDFMNGLTDASSLRVDSNGDGVTDFQLKPGGLVSDTVSPQTVASSTGILGTNGWAEMGSGTIVF